jgi:hypothetical protein
VQNELGVRVLSVVGLQQLSLYLRDASSTLDFTGVQSAVEAYQARYGVRD